MAKNWAALGGEKGKKVDTSRVGRALTLGKLATRFTGSMIRAGLGGKRDDGLEAMAAAALKNAHKIADALGEMKGAAMKVGQMLSADPDLVDPAFAERLATLQSEAPPMDYATVAAQIESQLDKPIDAAFRFFNPEPIGSASIGQVHRATLFDGREVAVKVQYPGIAGSIDSDLRNLGSLLAVGRVFVTKERAAEFVAEARHAILTEADYRREGENLARFRRLFEGRPGVRVPAPVLELTREQVLVMEFIDGRPWDAAVTELTDPAERNAHVKRFVELFVYMFHDLYTLHADPHPGNFMLDTDGNLVLLDWGCVRDFRPELADDVLRMLCAVWDDDMVQLEALFRRAGFGKEGMTYPSHQALREYHQMVLEPILHDRPFRFADFKMHTRVRAFLKQNISFLRLVPPAELLLYLRVLAGIKGLLTKVDAEVNLREIAEACCARRGIR